MLSRDLPRVAGRDRGRSGQLRRSIRRGSLCAWLPTHRPGDWSQIA